MMKKNYFSMICLLAVILLLPFAWLEFPELTADFEPKIYTGIEAMLNNWGFLLACYIMCILLQIQRSDNIRLRISQCLGELILLIYIAISPAVVLNTTVVFEHGFQYGLETYRFGLIAALILVILAIIGNIISIFRKIRS